MHALRLVDAERKEPFDNIGGHPVSAFQDLAVDRPATAAGVGEGVRRALRRRLRPDFEFPSGARLSSSTTCSGPIPKWRVEYGFRMPRSDEVPIYFCPIDYDILCGGIVATSPSAPTRTRSGYSSVPPAHSHRRAVQPEGHRGSCGQLPWTSRSPVARPTRCLTALELPSPRRRRTGSAPTGKSARSGVAYVAFSVDASSEPRSTHLPRSEQHDVVRLHRALVRRCA